MTAGKSKKKQSFEQSLEKLEKIVKDMEAGELSLDEMISRFEEGQGLIKFCTGKLNEVEKRIELLVKKGDKLVAEPLEDVEEETDEPAESEEQDDLF